MTIDTSRPPLRLAILSFAHTHAGSYIRQLSRRGDVEVLTSDPDGAQSTDTGLRGAEYAAAHGARYVESYEEVFDWKPDAVVICSENSKHAELVRVSAEAGAHILCEKPLATTVLDAQLAIDAAKAGNVKLMTAFPVRFSPAYVELRNLVRAGALGEIISVVGTNNGRMPTDRTWFTDPELAGGGALVDHVVHCADLLDDLLGMPARRVHAVANRVLHADRGVRVETGGLVTITYPDGTIATIDCSWNQPASAPNWGGLTLNVTGTKGSVKIDPFASHVGGFDARGAAWLPFGADLDSLMIDEFISALLSDRQPQPDGGSGLRTLAIVKAAQASVASGQAVDCY